MRSPTCKPSGSGIPAMGSIIRVCAPILQEQKSAFPPFKLRFLLHLKAQGRLPACPFAAVAVHPWWSSPLPQEVKRHGCREQSHRASKITISVGAVVPAAMLLSRRISPLPQEVKRHGCWEQPHRASKITISVGAVGPAAMLLSRRISPLPQEVKRHGCREQPHRASKITISVGAVVPAAMLLSRRISPLLPKAGCRGNLFK